MKKVLKINFKKDEHLISFIEYLKKSLSGEEVYFVIKGSGVKIIYEENRELSYKIKQAYKEWKSAYGGEGKTRRISIPFILRNVDLKVAIPISSVCDVLVLKGYGCHVEKEYFVSDVPIDYLLEITSRFSEKYSECLLLDAEPLAKRLIAVVATAYGIRIEKAIAFLVEKKLLYFDDKRKKYVLTMNYSQCVNRLCKDTK